MLGPAETQYGTSFLILRFNSNPIQTAVYLLEWLLGHTVDWSVLCRDHTIHWMSELLKRPETRTSDKQTTTEPLAMLQCWIASPVHLTCCQLLTISRLRRKNMIDTLIHTRSVQTASNIHSWAGFKKVMAAASPAHQ